jgi:hypothetical protein
VCERLAWFDLTTKGQEHRPHGIIDAAVGDCHIEDGLCLVGNRTPDAERLEHAAWSSRYGGGPDIIACPAKSRISERNDKILAERLPQGDGERLLSGHPIDGMEVPTKYPGLSAERPLRGQNALHQL